MKIKLILTICGLLGCLFMAPDCCLGQAPGKIPGNDLHLHLTPEKQEIATVVKILLMMTVLSIVPAILFTMTCFTRILIVLSFARQAFGVQNLPPNQVLIGLAIFLTVFVMTPVWQDIYTTAYLPYQNKKINGEQAAGKAMVTMRSFMLKHVREKDLALMIHLSKSKAPNSEAEIPTTVIIPAFVVSELTIAFQMGFLILLPFLIVDIIVSSTLLAMGMIMLPPVVISVPFKVLLFILVDGWHLVVKTLVVSFA